MICEAIRTRRYLEFHYDGHPRVVVPAAHGVHASTGNPVLRAYQVGGSSKTRPVPLWDLFRIDRIQGLTLSPDGFDAEPPGFRPGDRHISPICCEL